ncbi:MAG TPA: YciI family protein [Terracidiphilus sp.]|nr:YciI family protein [Terracidiphilus sp.]
MRFLSIYKCPERNTPPTPEEMARMGKLIEEWMKAGKLLSTEGCLPSSFGARVRVDSGKYNVSDGPFTEAKELVGGFAILDAPSKEAAVEYAKEFLKVVGQGECELRQLYDASTLPN